MQKIKNKVNAWIILWILKYLKIKPEVLQFAGQIQEELITRRLTQTQSKNTHFEILENSVQDLKHHVSTKCCDKYSKSVAAEISARLMLITSE